MSEFVSSDVVVMRTPLLPMEELEWWSAVAHDRTQLRARLQSLADRPEIAEALFVASPDLADSLGQWRRDPESKKGKRTEQGLVRYFLRMVSRPTPFGLFSGCTAGRVGDRTRLTLAARGSYRRHSRLDMDYLFALCEHLARDPEVRAELLFRPNSSLYEAAGRLRFAESRVHGRLRSYHLVAFDAFDALRDTLRRAKDGARLHDLATALVVSDPHADPDMEITLEDAQAFLHDLVDNQLLLPELGLLVTGQESTTGLLRQLDELRVAGDVRNRLAQSDRTLSDVDANGLGASTQRYRDLARDLQPLGVPVELSRLFQVDLVKPASEVVIGETVIAEVLRGVEILHRFSRGGAERPLDEFRSSFVERYGSEREVPLLDALDEETGIGYDRSGNAAAEASPLLSDLPLQRRGAGLRQAWQNSDAVRLQLLGQALAEGRTEIALTEEDIKRLENPERPPMPDAFHTAVVLGASSSEAIERGDFRLLFQGGMGPSGARMLGRFCHVDDAIRESVEKHVAAEEALRPEAVFAEVVHLPAGRLGNILARPVLREHEIVFLGNSGAPRDRQIPLDDLVVTVSGEQIRLRSRSLDREVIPRLSTAHNTNGGLGVYRFLAALQRPVALQWDWGVLDSAPFLPRVVSGRVVLSRARWRVSGAEMLAPDFRERHRMPRYVLFSDRDNELLVDFENAMALDAVIDLVRSRDEITLNELFPAPDELCAEGPEGRFFHELIVPFTRKPASSSASAAASRAPSPLIARTFPPGSEWLYAKLYTGTATADRVLCDELAPLAAEMVASGAARRWFFIRYGDPGWHLRVRFHGDPSALRNRVQPALEELAQRLIDAGVVWKVQFDTYEREVERYGGPESIELVEEIFHRDSEAVLAMLQSSSGDAGADLRWHLMLAGIDRLYADFGFDLPARLSLAERSRDAIGRQYGYASLRDRLAGRFRANRAALERVLDSPIPALDQRSAFIAPIARELLTRRLHAPLHTMLPSIIHMFVNRLARSAGPEHELVLYDYLVQLYKSRMARSEKHRGRKAVLV